MSSSDAVSPLAPGQPFDGAAADYDAAFTDRQLGRHLRAAVWAHLAETFRPGDTVLELGCGTGTDAVWLAQRGVQVVATDASSAMLAVASRKAVQAGVGGQVAFQALDLTDSPALRQLGVQAYTGVLSNFGALNCLPDRSGLAQALGRAVRPGGTVMLVVMGPWCPWEIAWHLLHGQVRVALRRLRSGAQANVGNTAKVRVWYPSPWRLRREFAPYFRHRRTVGIGAFLPPPYLAGIVDGRPRLLSALLWLEAHFADYFPWTWFNDHYLSVFERR